MSENVILAIVGGVLAIVNSLIGLRARNYFQNREEGQDRTQRVYLIQQQAKLILAFVELQNGISQDKSAIIKQAIEMLGQWLKTVGYVEPGVDPKQEAIKWVAGAAAENGYDLDALPPIK